MAVKVSPLGANILKYLCWRSLVVVGLLAGPRPGSAQTLGQALNATNGTWRTGGDAPWYVDTSTLHNGMGSIRSGTIAAGQQSWAEVGFSGPAHVNCAGRGNVSIVFNTDLCHAFGPSGGITLGDSWSLQQLAFGGASNVVRFTHNGTGTAWLDELQIVPDTNTPFIVMPPNDQLAYTGDTTDNSATFQVVATGAQPLNYYWFKDGTLLQDGGRISGSGTSTLQLGDIVTSDAGTYSVLVSNVWGTALCGFATQGNTFQQCGTGARLFVGTIFVFPVITGFLSNGQFQLQFPAPAAGQETQVLASTNLTDWGVVMTATNGSNLLNFTEPVSPGNHFYRLRQQPVTTPAGVGDN
jgi:hypothetical protein